MISSLPEHAASMLQSVLALNALTFVIFLTMYATRLPAMSRMKIAPQEAAHPRTALDRLPSAVRAVADNYNHLHEAPTVFYAAVFAIVLLGRADAVSARLSWGFVTLRLVHSAIQTTINKVTLRFAAFLLSWLCLGAMVLRALLA